MREPLFLQHQPQGFLQAEEKMHRHCAQKAFMRPRQPGGPVEIVFGQGRCLMHGHGLVGQAGKGQTGWQHQAFLATAHRAINAPFIHAEIKRAERGNRIHHEQSRMLGAVNRFAHVFQRHRHAGGGFIMHHTNRFDRVVFVGFQGRFQGCGIGPLVPFGRQGLHFKPMRCGHAPPAFGKMAGFHNQNPVARRKEIDEACFPSRVSRARIKEQMALGAENGFHALKAAMINGQKIGVVEIHRVMGHRLQHAVWNIGRAWIGEEQTPAGLYNLHHITFGLSLSERGPVHP